MKKSSSGNDNPPRQETVSHNVVKPVNSPTLPNLSELDKVSGNHPDFDANSVELNKDCIADYKNVKRTKNSVYSHQTRNTEVDRIDKNSDHGIFSVLNPLSKPNKLAGVLPQRKQSTKTSEHQHSMQQDKVTISKGVLGFLNDIESSSLSGGSKVKMHPLEGTDPNKGSKSRQNNRVKV